MKVSISCLGDFWACPPCWAPDPLEVELRALVVGHVPLSAAKRWQRHRTPSSTPLLLRRILPSWHRSWWHRSPGFRPVWTWTRPVLEAKSTRVLRLRVLAGVLTVVANLVATSLSLLSSALWCHIPLASCSWGLELTTGFVRDTHAYDGIFRDIARHSLRGQRFWHKYFHESDKPGNRTGLHSRLWEGQGLVQSRELF